jgi:hypothetical protein
MGGIAERNKAAWEAMKSFMKALAGVNLLPTQEDLLAFQAEEAKNSLGPTPPRDAWRKPIRTLKIGLVTADSMFHGEWWSSDPRVRLANSWGFGHPKRPLTAGSWLTGSPKEDSQSPCLEEGCNQKVRRKEFLIQGHSFSIRLGFSCNFCLQGFICD